MLSFYRIKKRCYFLFIIIVFIIFVILPKISQTFAINLLIFLNVLYFLNNIIKSFLFLYQIKEYNYKDSYEKNVSNLPDNQLPIYTILLPVRDEKYSILKNLLISVYNLDYPKEKLDIKFVVDENDIKTINVGKTLLKEFNFDLIIVPDSKIKSKPISCNYALKFIKGKFLTVYDAEDRPEKYQLKKVIEKFNNLDEDYICLQASLNFYNKYRNFITYCFSIEYSMWFDYTIRTIEKFGSFFPLGGTSNHFKSEKLLELGKWDGLNVTEDAELGIRIARAGYKISYIKSITEEECPISIYSWIKQRTRWIKGFMQTFSEYIFCKKPICIKSNIDFKPISEMIFF
ncbi:MAG TPA: glycosyltransferase [Rickettsiales bacterium]|nr:glycosyltransferase [Rickettsiales bacterium]